MNKIAIAGIKSIGKAHLRLDIPGSLKHEKTEASNVALFEKFTSELVTFLEGHAEQRRQVESNPDWSEAGKAKRLKEIDSQFLPQLNNFRHRMVGLKEQLTQDLAQYQPKSFNGSGNPILDELRAQEIRRYLLTLKPSDRVNLVLDPSNDQMILWAVKNSPLPIPDLDPSLIAKVEEYQAERLNPEGTLLSKDHEVLLDTLEYNLAEVGKAFETPNTELKFVE